MQLQNSRFGLGTIRQACLVLIATFCFAAPALAQQLSQLTLKNGMRFEGQFARTGKISQDIAKTIQVGGGSQPNVIVDDGLRRIFFPYRNLQQPVVPTNKRTKIKIDQRSPRTRKRVGNVGGVFGATPFDEFGRRIISVMAGGRQRVTQEIVEISPTYTKLQSPNFVWDMRIATSSIPSDQLKKVILQSAKGKNAAETRLEIVRLLSMSERYSEAAAELKTIIRDFPKLDKENHERLLQGYVQQYIDLILQEIARLRRAGQHRQAQYLLKGLDNTAAGTESLIQANDMLAGYEKSQKQAKRVLDKLAPLVESSEGDKPRQKMIQQLHEEIQADLNYSNLPRMATFLNLVDGDGLTNDEKLALGISGWLIGQEKPIRNLNVAASLLEVRNLVREYLRAMGSDKRAIREELLAKIKDREGGTPDYVTKLLANMKPPLDMPPAPAEPGIAGMSVVSVPDTDPNFPVEYTVQLPPEYDPYKRYPTVVTLHAIGSKPKSQITWWAGDYDKTRKRRIGQATRHGYIVIAPHWAKAKQGAYEYSAREHDIVLRSLRDASRRFSIDSDRVFISGHATGGDAAWDMAVAHPDLWAGMILIGARGDHGPTSPRYVSFYEENAKHFPLYLVYGGLDGGKWHDNSIHTNRYMRPGYDAIVIQYQGRGNEHFFEEIQNVFKWMELHQRRPMPKKFEVSSMRSSDNYFWFTEFRGLPPTTMVSPYAWPVDKPRATEIEASIGANNSIRVTSGAKRTTVWLSPEIVDFEKRIQIKVDGKTIREDYVPDLEVVLEDARRRADRQHVFWDKVTVP